MATRASACEVRLARNPDLSAIMAMAGAMHAEAPHYRNTPLDHQGVWNLAENLIDSSQLVLAVRGDAIIGMAAILFSKHWATGLPFACDLTVYVDPEARRSGACIALVAELERLASEHGCANLQLGVSSGVHNEAVAKLYESLGYRRHSIGLLKGLTPSA